MIMTYAITRELEQEVIQEWNNNYSPPARISTILRIPVTEVKRIIRKHVLMGKKRKPNNGCGLY